MPIKLLTVKFFAAAVFASALFLFLPLTVYMLNLESLTTPKMTVLLCGGVFASVMAFLFWMCSLMPGSGRLLVILFQAGTVSIVILTAIPNQTGELSGFGEFLLSFQDIKAVSKLIFTVIVTGLLAWRKSDLFKQLYACAVVIVIMVSIYAALMTTSTADNRPKKDTNPPAAFTELGTANVIVVVFDSFTGYRMKEVLNEHPDLREKLDGFVHYPRAIASALSTPGGLSAILTGDLKIALQPDIMSKRMTDTFNSSFLAEAMRKEFNTGFVSMYGGTFDVPRINERDFFRQEPLGFLDRLPDYLGFFNVSLLRIAPRFVYSTVEASVDLITEKKFKNASTDWQVLNSLRSGSEKRCQFGKMALKYFIDNIHIVKSKGSVLVFHSMVAHPPHNLTESGKYLASDAKGYEGTSVYAAKELARLCEALRSLGVYDSTLLIAVADHGSMPVKDITMGKIFSHDNTLPLEFNPLLMVKAPGAHGPCKESQMSVWNGDVAPTVRDYLGVPNLRGQFESRSLLQAETPDRSLNVPVFFRPDQVGFGESYSLWVRKDLTGTFQEYGNTIAAQKPEKLLESRTDIRLTSGVDRVSLGIMKKGWTKSKETPYCAAIEINGRLLSKLTSSGVTVVSGGKGGYKTSTFNDIKEAEKFLQDLPAGSDRLVVGLKVPVAVANRLFPQEATAVDQNKPVGFVAVSGPSYGNSSKAIVGSDDISLAVKWKQ